MSTSTRVFLVRHGATVLTAEDRFAGSIDVPLSDEGCEQARRLAERLRGEPLAAAYASPLGRAVDTAGLIAAPHGLTVRTDPGLREISHGRWEEMTRAEVQAKYPDEAAGWDADPYTFAPEGGETGLDVTARALPAMLRIVREHPGQSVLVVDAGRIRLLFREAERKHKQWIGGIDRAQRVVTAFVRKDDEVAELRQAPLPFFLNDAAPAQVAQ